MKRAVISILGLALVWGCAQVSTSEYVKEHSRYNASDGWFQRVNSRGFDLHVNGQRLVSAGKAVYEDFSEYGDGDDWCVQSDNTGCSGTAATSWPAK